MLEVGRSSLALEMGRNSVAFEIGQFFLALEMGWCSLALEIHPLERGLQHLLEHWSQMLLGKRTLSEVARTPAHKVLLSLYHGVELIYIIQDDNND